MIWNKLDSIHLSTTETIIFHIHDVDINIEVFEWKVHPNQQIEENPRSIPMQGI